MAKKKFYGFHSGFAGLLTEFIKHKCKQINNTCSDSDRRALIYHWNMYMNPKNRSGFHIVEDPQFSSEDDVSVK